MRHRAQSVDAELSIERLGARGDGVAAWQGEAVFVPFAVPGDRVRVRLGKRRAGGREARLVELLAPGTGRAEPVCPHFGRCGGCALQHLDPETYRALKLGALHGALHHAGIDPGVVAPLQTVPGARRRARLGLLRPKDQAADAVVGFRERFSHALVDVRACAVLEPALFGLVAPLRHLVRAAFSPGEAVEAMMTRTDSGVDLLIEAPASPRLALLEALAAFAGEYDLARIVWRTRGSDIPVIERRPVRVMLSGVAVPFPAGAFLQASAAAEAVLAAEVVAGVGSDRPVLDLYSGLGTFAFALGGGGPIHAVEGDAAAAAAFAEAALGIRQVSGERRDLERDPIPPETLAHYRAVVCDPPRAGAARQVAALATSPVPTIAAVSCNPATFARDAAMLTAGGYRLERVVPIDQFVWTPHLELAAVFRR